MDATVLKSLGDLGIPLACLVVLAYVFLKGQVDSRTERQQRDEAFARLTENNNQALNNNTQALTRLCGSTDSTNDALKEHDARAQRMEQTLTQVVGGVGRIEQKVEDLHKRERS